jgi:hypothetical protein
MTRSRNIGICVMVALLGAASLTSAQVNIDDEIELSRSVIQTQRQAIVTEAMQLTEAESKVFWPLFREFQGEMAKVGDRKVALITSYAENFETFTDDQARLMMDEWLDIEKARLKVLGKYVKSFRNIQSAIRNQPGAVPTYTILPTNLIPSTMATEPNRRSTPCNSS